MGLEKYENATSNGFPTNLQDKLMKVFSSLILPSIKTEYYIKTFTHANEAKLFKMMVNTHHNLKL